MKEITFNVKVVRYHDDQSVALMESIIDCGEDVTVLYQGEVTIKVPEKKGQDVFLYKFSDGRVVADIKRYESIECYLIGSATIEWEE